MAQSALSYHMKIICDPEVAHERLDGKWVRYSLNGGVIRSASKRLSERKAVYKQVSSIEKSA